MRTNRYTEQEFIDAVKTSRSIAKTLQKLGLSATGGNYETVKRHINILNLDITHMTGQSWNKGQNFGPKRPIEDYLSNKYFISSHHLKIRLIKEGVKSHKCELCDRTQWNEQIIPIQLHHIDGNNKNNHLDNLQILCPNCHSQTDTWCSKNRN